MKSFPSTIYILIILLFSNTASSGIFGPKAAKFKEPLKDHEGIVLIQFVMNNRFQRGLSNWDYVIVKNLKTNKKKKLLPLYDNGRSASIIFSGILERGDYKLIEIEEVSEYAAVSISTETTTIPITERLGAFKISGKKITDLGTVIIHPDYMKNKKGDVERIMITSRTDEKSDLTQFLKELRGDYYYSTILDDVIGWNEKMADWQLSMLEMIKRKGVPFKHYRLPDQSGKIIFHKLGKISHKVGSESWQSTHTGYYSNFRGYARFKQGHLLAGEYGVLLYSEEFSGPWKKLDIIDPRYNIIDIQVKDNKVIAKATYFQSKLSKCPDPKDCYGISTLEVDLVAGTYEKINKTQEEATFETMSFTDKAFQKQANGMISKSRSMYKHSISVDNEKSWKKLKTKMAHKYSFIGYNNPRSIYIASDQMVYVVASPTKRFKGRKKIEHFVKPEVLQLFKGPIDKLHTKKSTYKVAEINPYCSSLVPGLSVDDELYLSCVNGNLLVSKDEGVTWDLEFDNFLELLTSDEDK